jgi:hypothetical protein
LTQYQIAVRYPIPSLQPSSAPAARGPSRRDHVGNGRKPTASRPRASRPRASTHSSRSCRRVRTSPEIPSRKSGIPVTGRRSRASPRWKRTDITDDPVASVR